MILTQKPVITPHPLPQDGHIVLDEDATSGLVRQVRREARANPPLVASQLLDCTVQLAAKAPVYALLVGEWFLAACVVWLCWGRGEDGGDDLGHRMLIGMHPISAEVGLKCTHACMHNQRLHCRCCSIPTDLACTTSPHLQAC